MSRDLPRGNFGIKARSTCHTTAFFHKFIIISLIVFSHHHNNFIIIKQEHINVRVSGGWDTIDMLDFTFFI